MTAAATKQRKSGIKLPAEDFKAALQAVKAAVPGRAVRPVLANVKIGHGLIVGTDLELQVAAEIDYQGDPILLPFARLQAIMSACPNAETVTLTPDGSTCTVSVGGGRWTLPTEDAAEFPAWEPADTKPIARIPADQLNRAVRSVAYATDNESSRYALGAVLVEVKDGTVMLVATDGRRLAACEIEVDQAVDDSATLVPSRAINVIASAASDSDWAVQLEANAKEVVATVEGLTITARLVEGRFPRWRDVLTDRNLPRSVVSNSDLLAATRAAAVCTSEQSKGVQFAVVDNGIHLTASSPEAGQSSVTCDLQSFGQAAAFTLDPRFVEQLLRSVDPSEPVEIEAVDAQSAVQWFVGDCRAVIMPLAKE